jgi:hypothetical protein
MNNAELISLQRSAAMAAPGSAVPMPRERVLELLDEVLSSRSLLERLGTDLRSVADHGRSDR